MSQTLIAQLSTLISGGALLPLLISLLTRSHWDVKIKQAILIGFSAIGAILAYLATHGWSFTHSPQDALAAFLVVFAAGQAAYHTVWKQSGLSDAVSNLTDGGSSDDGTAVAIDPPTNLPTVTPVPTAPVATPAQAAPAPVAAPRQQVTDAPPATPAG